MNIHNVFFNKKELHFTVDVKQFLSNTFCEDRVIARRFNKHWSELSPDLTPLDFYFQGILKFRVYANGPFVTLSALKSQIVVKIESISKDEISNAIYDVLYRCELVMQLKGEDVIVNI